MIRFIKPNASNSKRICFFICIFIFIGCISKAQTGTFLALDDNDNIYKVTISASGCSSVKVSGCYNAATNNLLSIALDGTTLYIVDNNGILYSSTYNTTTNSTSNCKTLGTFLSGSGAIYGLTVGPNGIVYASYSNKIETYTPSTKKFAAINGNISSTYAVGGDLLFYNGKLYVAVYVNGNRNDNRLVEINLGNLSSSTEYLKFNSGAQVFGFASVTIPCSNNQSYALSSGSTTNIYAVDMVAKTQSATVFCTLNYNVYDAASVAETQTATAPIAPTVNSPFNICLNSVVASFAPTPDAGDTLRWYTSISSGVPTGTPKGTPAISSATVSSTNYYVTQFDVITKCESQPSTIVVNVVALPTITIPITAQSICQNTASTAIAASASAGSGTVSNSSYQWYSNTTASNTGGTIITGAISASYIPPTSTVGVTYYYCVVINSNGCSTTSNVSGAIVVKASSNSTTPISICPSALPYTWNGTAYNTAGTYTKIFTNAVGCDSVATLALTVKATSTSNTPVSICPSALPYTWNGTAYNTAGTYTKTFFNAVGCDSIATLVLTVKATSTSSTPVSICPSALPYTWNGTAYNAPDTYTKTFTNAVGCDSIAILVLTVKATSTSSTPVSICPNALPYTWNGTIYNAAGTYTRTLTNAAGCDSIATLNLAIETFTISLSANPNPAFGGVAFTGQITANLPIASSIWQPSNLFVNNLSTQTIVAPDTSFTLVVTGLSANGCRSTVSRLITVMPSNNTIFIPNALTPAAVGTDASVIKVYGTTVKTAQLLVYNQWGQLIFQTDSATTRGWDGTFNGKAQPSGVYNYVVRIMFQNNKVETKSGSINLIR